MLPIVDAMKDTNTICLEAFCSKFFNSVLAQQGFINSFT